VKGSEVCLFFHCGIRKKGKEGMFQLDTRKERSNERSARKGRKTGCPSSRIREKSVWVPQQVIKKRDPVFSERGGGEPTESDLERKRKTARFTRGVLALDRN